jgi:large subunit ribosomal protein L12
MLLRIRSEKPHYQLEVKSMEYMYAAMLLHSAGKEIAEGAVTNILNAAGISPDNIRVKALVAALAEVDIDEAVKAPVLTAATAAPAAVPAEEEAEEEPKEEEKEEEEDLQGLSALFM